MISNNQIVQINQQHHGKKNVQINQQYCAKKNEVSWKIKKNE